MSTSIRFYVEDENGEEREGVIEISEDEKSVGNNEESIDFFENNATCGEVLWKICYCFYFLFSIGRGRPVTSMVEDLV